MLKRTMWLTILLATLTLLGGGTVMADKPSDTGYDDFGVTVQVVFGDGSKEGG